MAQADQTVQNDTFPTVRADINNNLAALFSCSSGSSAPSTTVAYMDWIDISGTDPVWKKRNAANNAWITIGTIKSSSLELASANVLPAQSGNSGKYLTTNGTVASWAAVPIGLSTTALDTQTFNSSGVWNKPASGTWALIRCWGGGGSGGKGTSTGPAGGGGGGAFVEKIVPMSSLNSTETVTIGSGGAGQTVGLTTGNNGGNTTFGSSVTAYGGGGGGYNAEGGSGGGGGGGNAAGGNGGTSLNVGGTGGSDLATSDKTKNVWFAFGAVDMLLPTTSPATTGLNAQFNTVVSGGGGRGGYILASGLTRSIFISIPSTYGGGGGGTGADGTGTDGVANKGANSTWGGGGGGGSREAGTPGNAGTSTYGGNGSSGAIDGNASLAAAQPGGGSGGTEGGNSGAGGAGRCIVYVY